MSLYCVCPCPCSPFLPIFCISDSVLCTSVQYCVSSCACSLFLPIFRGWEGTWPLPAMHSLVYDLRIAAEKVQGGPLLLQLSCDAMKLCVGRLFMPFILTVSREWIYTVLFVGVPHPEGIRLAT